MRKRCSLDVLAGRDEPCTEAGCPFWEPGGAVLEGRCVFEPVDLEGRPALVSELQLMRARMVAARGEDTDELWRAYHRLLNEAGEE